MAGIHLFVRLFLVPTSRSLCILSLLKPHAWCSLPLPLSSHTHGTRTHTRFTYTHTRLTYTHEAHARAHTHTYTHMAHVHTHGTRTHTHTQANGRKRAHAGMHTHSLREREREYNTAISFRLVTVSHRKQHACLYKKGVSFEIAQSFCQFPDIQTSIVARPPCLPSSLPISLSFSLCLAEKCDVNVT